MVSLRKYTGNVYRFSEVILANHGGRQVSIVGVNGTQDHLVIGGYRDDFLVPRHELAVPDDQRQIFDDQLTIARGVIGGC